MKKKLFLQLLLLSIIWSLAAPGTSHAQDASAVSSPPDAPSPGTASTGVRIIGLAEDPARGFINGKESHVGLNSKLWVVLNKPIQGSAADYSLFLNDEQIVGLDAPIATTLGSQPALLFKITRSTANDTLWREMLGSPRQSHIPVAVSVGHRTGSIQSERVTGTPADATFAFQVYTPVSAVISAAVIVLILVLVWGTARYRTTLRDNLLPQLPAPLQPYSLGRSQMAFWFTLIFAAFVILFCLLQDTNTLTAQALALMGISGVTAGAAIAVDVAKNSPADDINRALQALGLKSYADVVELKQQVEIRQRALAALPATRMAIIPLSAASTSQSSLPPGPISVPDARRVQLQVEINDRLSILRMYDEKTRPFVSQGWFKDVTTDLNGPTVHRLQVVIWTAALGAIFLYSVYRNLAMPEYNGTLLALMGVSGLGYVGFKVQEVNN